jgi:cation diffusion facilitator family transporter
MLYKVAKKYNSQALEADALHFSSDIWSSAVVLFGLVCAHFGFFIADSVAALVVAVIVLYVCYRLGKKSIDVLLDKAPQDKVDKIKQTLAIYPEVKDFHSLKIRSAGADTFVSIKISMDSQTIIKDAHEICDNLEKDICFEIDRCDVLIHVEPLNQEINQEGK